MNGTHASGDTLARDPTSPFIDEVQARQQDILSGAPSDGPADRQTLYLDGATERLTEAVKHATAGLETTDRWNTPEARRERRARDMELARMMAIEVAARMAEAMAGRIPEYQCPMFGQIKDPVAAFANLNRAIIQIAMYEDRLDESAEERAARLAAENTARAQAAQKAETQRGYTQSQGRRAERRTHIQRAMREITIDCKPDLDCHEREDLLDELFLEYDFDENASWDRNPAEIVYDLCARVGFEFTPIDPALRNEERDPADRRSDALKLVQHYLDATESRGDERYGDEDEDDESPSAPPAQAQGPPH
jgi:hypothetical protein